MVRVNDCWVENDGDTVELVAGDLIELTCIDHAAVRHHGWYTAQCSEYRGDNVVFQAWRYVPQDGCLRMLAPNDEAKSFFPQPSQSHCAEESPPCAASCSESLVSDDEATALDSSPTKEFVAVHLRLAGAPTTRCDVRPKLADADAFWG